jgi:hypothetical protein
MSDEGDLAMPDAAQAESGGQELPQEWVEPNPADYGISLGTDSHTDQCWEDFQKCAKSIRDTMSLDGCIAKLDECRRKSTLSPNAEPM